MSAGLVRDNLMRPVFFSLASTRCTVNDLNIRKSTSHLPQRCLAAYQASGDVEDLRDLYEFQEGYFLREERNKRHFSKFGNWFGRHWFSEAYGQNGGGNAQNVLDKHVVEMDVLQYFSRTASIDGDCLLEAVRTDPALIAHWRLLEEVLQTVKPQWIQVHGKTCWKVMEALLMDGNGAKIKPWRHDENGNRRG